jgi:DNA-binding response OmpR family regulator
MVGRAIAMLEDDPSLRELLREVLESEGHLVIMCQSLLEVHQAAIRGASLVIADTWGPGQATLGAAERQQILDLARLVPTILTSGRAWASHAYAQDLGLAGLLVKPFDLWTLIALVETLQGQAPLASTRPAVSSE